MLIGKIKQLKDRGNSVKILDILLRNIIRKAYSCYHITKDTFHKTKILTLIMKHNNLWVSEKHPKYFSSDHHHANHKGFPFYFLPFISNFSKQNHVKIC